MASSFLPLDTISIAMTNAPKAVPVLSNIYKLSTDIRETSERVDVNKQQCEQLSERIDTLIGFLVQRDLSDHLSEAMHIALHRFETFLQRCLEYITTFVETTWFKRIINSKDHEKKFQDLNRELTQYSNDLNFGIGLNNLHMNKKPDGNDRANVEVDEYEKDSEQQEAPEMAADDQHIQTTNRDSTTESKNVFHTDIARPSLNIQQAQRNIFVSGLWKYRYNQYNQSYGPFQQQLVFNPTTRTLQGHGRDNVGHYILNGSFSEVTGRIEMMQHYQVGTGDPSLNFGHQDLIQLSWNRSRNLFEGLAYSQVGGNYVPGALIEMARI